MDTNGRKTILTVSILLMGSFFAVSFNAAPASAYQSMGLVIDFGDRDVEWTDLDLNSHKDPVEALEYVCYQNGFELKIENNVVTKIRETENTSEYIWGFWVIEQGSLDWKIADPTDCDISEKTLASWAYCSQDDRPTVGVDQYGRSIYGYPQAYRVVTLSPSLTEIVGALNAVNTLVGTDKYSNYPDSVVRGQDQGDIAIVGDFLNPSFEYIMKTDPDVVFCDGSQYSHYEMAEKIRKTSVNSIVMYSGQSIDTILDNIYIMGVVMNYELRSLEVISQLITAEEEIIKKIGGGSIPMETMIALSPDKSPWVSGRNTYADDILTTIMGINAFSSMYEWVQVNSESIAKANPSVIITITEDYKAAESEYGVLLKSLSGEWKSTYAYENGLIFAFCENLAEMSQRAGPRYAQIMEILFLILDDLENAPRYIGNDYENYLTITKSMGYNS